MARQVNILEAKTQLSKLVDAIETGQEPEIVIARGGRPVARLIALEAVDPATVRANRLGVAAGRYVIPSLEDFNASDAEVAALFGAGVR